MKRFIFLFLALSSVCLWSNEAYERKSIKNILVENDFAILLLSDGNIWKVCTANVIEQTWSEWWKEIYPKQPEKEFLSNFDEWESFSQVEIAPLEKKDLDLEKFHNKEILNCDYCINNLKTNTRAFGKKITIEELFLELLRIKKCDCNAGQMKSEYYKGYRDGYVLGFYEKINREKREKGCSE